MIQKRLPKDAFWLPFGRFLVVFFDMFFDVFFGIAFFHVFLLLLGAIWEPLGDPWGPKWGELATENSILSRTPSGGAFWEALGSILGVFLEDFDDIWGWILACGLLAVCLLLAMVCFWFACVLRLAVRFFVAFLVFLGVPLCSLVFPAFLFLRASRSHAKTGRKMSE